MGCRTSEVIWLKGCQGYMIRWIISLSPLIIRSSHHCGWCEFEPHTGHMWDKSSSTRGCVRCFSQGTPIYAQTTFVSFRPSKPFFSYVGTEVQIGGYYQHLWEVNKCCSHDTKRHPEWGSNTQPLAPESEAQPPDYRAPHPHTDWLVSIWVK